MQYMTGESDWPTRIYREVEVTPGVFAMRDVTDETAESE